MTGNGDYRSTEFVAAQPGTYRWVATYSGDAYNTGAGPTACGDSAETAALTSGPLPSVPPGMTPGANFAPGPNVAVLAHRKVKHPHPHKTPPPPPVTG